MERAAYELCAKAAIVEVSEWLLHVDCAPQACGAGLIHPASDVPELTDQWDMVVRWYGDRDTWAGWLGDSWSLSWWETCTGQEAGPLAQGGGAEQVHKPPSEEKEAVLAMVIPLPPREATGGLSWCKGRHFRAGSTSLQRDWHGTDRWGRRWPKARKMTGGEERGH